MSRPTPADSVLIAAAAVTSLTGLGVLVGLVAPGVAGTVRPHPALSGSVDDAASILINNCRVLAAPFLLILAGATRTTGWRRVGDTVMLALTAASSVPVGVELGRWQAQLVPYIPQLPLEFAGLAAAVSAWVYHRENLDTRQLVSFLSAALVLITAAAAVETWCTPRAHAVTALSPSDTETVQSSRWGTAVVSATEYAPPSAGRCKVACSLSLTPFDSAQPLGGAVPCSQQPPTPTGGITCSASPVTAT